LNKHNQFTIVRSISDINKIKEHWIEWQKHPNSDLDFFHTIIKSRKETATPYVIAIPSKKNPKAIAVARLENSQLPVKIGYKILFYLKIKIIVIVYDGLIGEITPQIYETIISALREAFNRKEAEMARFELINLDSGVYKKVLAKISFLFREHFITTQTHWKMHTPNDINNFYSKLSKHHRNKLRKVVKKIDNDFKKAAIRIYCFQSLEEIETMITDVEIIAKKTYQREFGAGFINNEENRSRLILEAEKEWLRMHVLYLKDRPCAYWWTLIYKQTLYSCAMGYDPEYSDYSPGTYLMLNVFENLLRYNIKSVDFGAGNALYKQQFGDINYEEASVHITSQTLKGFYLNFILSLNNLIILMAKKILNYFHSYNLIKKYWRNKLKSTKKHQSHIS
jgi:Acetyltransferase (GNAT) domain